MSDFLFLYPQWLLGIIPWLGMVYWLSKRQRSQTLIAPHLAKAMGLKAIQTSRWSIKVIGVCGIVAFIALSGPSFSEQERPSFSSTNARVLVMDMSMSMYATDLKPNRLTLAKYKVTDLLKQWTDGTTGLIAYAGDAYHISPMTSDSQTIANLIPNLSPELMPYPGANAAAGVKLAMEMMTNVGLSQGDIVLIADDLNDTERGDIEQLMSGSSWRLIVLGMGSRAGAPIKLNDGTLMTKTNGQPVVAKSNFDNMRALASSVDGYFVPVQVTNSDVEKIADITSDVGSADMVDGGQAISERTNQGYWLLPMLLIPALMIFRRGLFLSALLVFVPLMSPKPAAANPWLNDEQQAMQYFQNQEYDKAAELFNNPEWKGAAQYLANDFKGAINSLKHSTSLAGQY
ncbi:VWA domain-containing protein, partial [Vibrio sp. M260118]|uniref:VWA domain-containing protein n=1 Tax=Vibrio sp. M260118 TaxID=3020896 RepID=UPI002F4007E3